MHTDDPERIDRVVVLAEERLPLEQIATGPADELDLGPEVGTPQRAGLRPAVSEPLPGQGRASCPSRSAKPGFAQNRNMAVRTLAAWGREAWPEEAETLLRDALKNEPREDTGDYMRRALAGEPLVS